MAAHHDTDVDALERAVVEVHAGEGLCDEAGCRAKARAVIVFHQIVVDRLGNVDRTQFVVCLLCLLVDDADGIGRIITSDIEEVTNVVGLHDLEHAGAVFFIGFVASRKESRRWRIGDLLEVVCGLAREVDEVFLDDSAHSVDGPVNRGDLGKFAGFEGDADDALVDDGCGATTLGDQYFSF